MNINTVFSLNGLQNLEINQNSPIKNMTEIRTDSEPVSWHWSEISKEAILRKNPAIKRIRNKLKDNRKALYRSKP
jgi:hypothetical protein